MRLLCCMQPYTGATVAMQNTYKGLQYGIVMTTTSDFPVAGAVAHMVAFIDEDA